jgi:acyl-CoA thioesterase-2
MRARDRLHPSDLELIDVDVDDDGLSGRFVLGPGLVRHDGALYGGTGLAASVMAFQAASGRDVLWTTTQFVSSPVLGTELRWEVEVLAEGKRSSQLQLRAVHDGGVAFTALGSAGIGSDAGLTGQWRTMPKVSPPSDARPWEPMRGANAHPQSWSIHIDLREAAFVGDEVASTALWARRHDGRPFTAAAIAFAADFVPLGVARAAGKMGAGSSLDNSLRFRPGLTTEWILLELYGDFASGGYGHGEVLVWGQDGTLVASGSQTAAMKYLFDEGEPNRLPGPRD